MTLSIAFGEGAAETFEDMLKVITDRLPDLVVQVTPEDGSEPFDAILTGGRAYDSEWLDEVEVLRCDEDGEPLTTEREYIRVQQILVY